MSNQNNIKENIRALRKRVQEAAGRCGRDPDTIRIMAVTKTQPFRFVQSAYDAGIRLFGENRSDELTAKYSHTLPGAEVHMIGHLQRNKAADVVPLVNCIGSVDKYSTAAAIHKSCQKNNRTMSILLEYNTSGESSKYGFANLQSSFAEIDRILKLNTIHIDGVMTIAPFTDDTDAVRSSFAALRTIYEDIEQRYELGMQTLSMGMTADFELAIEEGSTLIRVGSYIFGARS